MKIQQDLNLYEPASPKNERLPTNTLSHRNRVHRWANFIAGYSIEFVEQCLEQRNAQNDIVLDPFLGCGTTLVAAKNNGFEGIGIDRHPVFYNLAKAKTGNYTIDDLDEIKVKLITHTKTINWGTDATIYLEKLFCHSDLPDIGKASSALNGIDPRLKPLAIAFYLKSCEASCGAQTDGIYKAPTSLKKRIPFTKAIENVYELFREDIETQWYKSHWVNQPEQLCFNQSSTNLEIIESDSLGICITSPPYLNNFDYGEMTRMHLYLLGWANSWKEISQNVRNDLITNTTTALKDKKSPDYQSMRRDTLPKILLTELDEIVADLDEERKTRAGKKEYNYLVYIYYSEIWNVLSEVYRTLKNGGEVHWVVADAALYGVHIKTHLHTALIMEHLGFKDVVVEFLRKRGHRWILNKRDGAKEGLGEYHIRAVKGH